MKNVKEITQSSLLNCGSLKTTIKKDNNTSDRYETQKKNNKKSKTRDRGRAGKFLKKVEISPVSIDRKSIRFDRTKTKEGSQAVDY